MHAIRIKGTLEDPIGKIIPIPMTSMISGCGLEFVLGSCEDMVSLDTRQPQMQI